MGDGGIVVPAAVAGYQAAVHGAAGETWVASVPSLVAEFVERWDLREVGPASGDATASFVAPAISAEGDPVIIKVAFIDDATRREADALRAWAGRGAVRVLASEPDLGALMLERLTPGTRLSEHHDRDAAISIACALLRGLWQAPRSDHRFGRVTDVAGAWAIELPRRWESSDAPFARELVDAAASLCLTLETPDRPQVIANGDFHLGNVLAAERAPWLVVDPQPLAGEPAFDTGYLVLSLLGETATTEDATRLVRRVAHALGVDADRVRTWAFVRAVERALWERETGLGDGTRPIEVAEALT